MCALLFIHDVQAESAFIQQLFDRIPKMLDAEQKNETGALYADPETPVLLTHHDDSFVGGQWSASRR